MFTTYKSYSCLFSWYLDTCMCVCVCYYWKCFYHFKYQLFRLALTYLKTQITCIFATYKDELTKLTLVLVAFCRLFWILIYNYAAQQLNHFLSFFACLFAFFPFVISCTRTSRTSLSQILRGGDILLLLPLTLMLPVGFLLWIIFTKLRKL